jgi:hypothetical protein
MYPGVTNLITERDKALYKAKVDLPSPHKPHSKIGVIEEITLSRFLNQLLERHGTPNASLHARF